MTLHKGDIVTIDHEKTCSQAFISADRALKLSSEKKAGKFTVLDCVGGLALCNPHYGGTCCIMLAESLCVVRRPWTPDEIACAKSLCLEIIEGLFDKSLSVKFDCNGYKGLVNVFIYLDGYPNQTYAAGSATACSNDEFDYTIGRCVALCKALDRPIPDFILNKNGGAKC